MKGGNGFTLIELLVVIGIISALTALLVPAVRGVRRNADRLTATSHMRQIGTAILHYAGETDGLLPGPLQAGQKAGFKTGDTKQLATVLAPYLVGEEPAPNSTSKVFLSPAFVRAMKNRDLAKSHPFMMNISPVVDGVKIQPFGSDAPGKISAPMKVVAVPSSIWILCDADQKNPGVIGQPWAGDTPVDVIHGSERLALHLDGSVQTIAASVLEATAKPSKPPKP
jgi:prepilin-type N-terminal cleavage/methylation domain-containing protein